MRNYVAIREPQDCIILQTGLVLPRLFILGTRLAWPLEQLLASQIVWSGGELKKLEVGEQERLCGVSSRGGGC